MNHRLVKPVVIAVLALVNLALIPLVLKPLPYQGLNWANLGGQLYYSQPDSYEPDNSPADAKNIVVNDWLAQYHTFHVPGDQDWITFNVVQGRTYVVSTNAGAYGSSADTLLSLYDHNTVYVGSDDNSNGNNDSRFQFSAGYTGVYYAMLRNVDSLQFGNTNWYYVQVDDAPVSHTLTPASGGVLVAPLTGGGQTQITVPAQAVAASTVLTYSVDAASGASLGDILNYNLVPLGYFFDLNLSSGAQYFNALVTIEVHYTDADLASAGITHESTLRLYRWGQPCGQIPNWWSLETWAHCPGYEGEYSQVDPVHNILTGYVRHLSLFGIVQERAWFLPVIRR